MPKLARLLVIACMFLLNWPAPAAFSSFPAGSGAYASESAEMVRASGSSFEWSAFAAFAKDFEKTKPDEDPILRVWSTSCQIWPRSFYCGDNGADLIAKAPISEFDYELPFSFMLAAQHQGAAVEAQTPSLSEAGLPRPDLTRTVLYDDPARDHFKGCLTPAAPVVPDGCQSVGPIKNQIRLSRAVWSIVNKDDFSVVLFIQKDIDDSCPTVPHWTTSCQQVRRKVDISQESACNQQDAPWESMPIDLGCFPHLRVTKQNAGSFGISPASIRSENPSFAVLLAFHIMETDPSDSAPARWKMMTFWWQGRQSDSKLGTPCAKVSSCKSLSPAWQHFQMVRAVPAVTALSRIPAAYNPYLDQPIKRAMRISCNVCHTFAGSPNNKYGEGTRFGRSESMTPQKLKKTAEYFFRTYHVSPTAQDWSLAFVLSTPPPAKKADRTAPVSPGKF